MNLDEIIDDFDKRVKDYNSIINEVIPYYEFMLKSIVNFLHYTPDESIKVLDLGCGIGNTTDAVLKKYKNAHVVSVDLSPSAISIAKSRFEGKNVQVIKSDIRADIIYKPNYYHCIVSNLAIHHLCEEKDKLLVYKKIFSSLKRGGNAVIGENVHGTTHALTKKYEEIWFDYMRKVGLKDKQINQYYIEYLEKDYPSPLMTQLGMMEKIGFISIDCIWKYSFFAVFCGSK